MTPLEKVRALVRLAESTTFPAEAESARAKALELMATHHITEEMLRPPAPVAPPPPPQPAPSPWTGVVWQATGNTTVSGFGFGASGFYVRFVRVTPNGSG